MPSNNTLAIVNDGADLTDVDKLQKEKPFAYFHNTKNTRGLLS